MYIINHINIMNEKIPTIEIKKYSTAVITELNTNTI